MGVELKQNVSQNETTGLNYDYSTAKLNALTSPRFAWNLMGYTLLQQAHPL